MISSAWKTPREPPAHWRSPKLLEVGRVYGEASRNGTPCQEWLFSLAGVAWSPVMAEGVGAEVEQARYLGVYFLYDRGFSVEVSVLASGVGRLDVDEEEVVVVPVRLQRLELTGDAFALFEELHAGEAGQALVHRVAGDGGGVEVVGLVEGGEGGVHPEAAYQDRVRGVLVGQDLVGLLDEGVGDLLRSSSLLATRPSARR